MFFPSFFLFIGSFFTALCLCFCWSFCAYVCRFIVRYLYLSIDLPILFMLLCLRLVSNPIYVFYLCSYNCLCIDLINPFFALDLFIYCICPIFDPANLLLSLLPVSSIYLPIYYLSIYLSWLTYLVYPVYLTHLFAHLPTHMSIY